MFTAFRMDGMEKTLIISFICTCDIMVILWKRMENKICLVFQNQAI